MKDMVNNPPHYTKHPSGIECIEVTEHMSFCLGNAVKYIWRADEKWDANEDLEKAIWYIEREIKKRSQDKESFESPSPYELNEFFRDLRKSDIYEPEITWVCAGEDGWVNIEAVSVTDIEENPEGRDICTFNFLGDEHRSLVVTGSKPG